jgi:hypothetical protein
MKKLLDRKRRSQRGSQFTQSLLSEDNYVELAETTSAIHAAGAHHPGVYERRKTHDPKETVVVKNEDEDYWKNIPEGYSWDICIVVPYDAHELASLRGDPASSSSLLPKTEEADIEKQQQPEEKENEGENGEKYSPDHVSFGQIVERLYQAGLQTYCFQSCDLDEIYIKVRAPLRRLAQHATEIGMEMLLDPTQLREKIDNKEAPIEDDHEVTPLTPYQSIFAPFDDGKKFIF